jgi:hypothetical protein
MTVRALAYQLATHELRHLCVLRTRYKLPHGLEGRSAVEHPYD